MRSSSSTVFFTLFLFLPVAATAADLQKGLAALGSADYETAMAECLPLAEAGDAAAQFCVGQMYANGFGVAMDDAAALNWYGLAAAQNHGEAQFNLAVMHANGWGVPMDDVEAAKWYKLSAENGYLPGQTTMAALYVHARGVEENLEEALSWYLTAEQLGEAQYTAEMQEIAAKLSEDAIITAQHKADSRVRQLGGKTMQADNSR